MFGGQTVTDGEESHVTNPHMDIVRASEVGVAFYWTGHCSACLVDVLGK